MDNKKGMTVRQFLNYLEAQPLTNEELLNKEIFFRFRESSGSYSQVVNPAHIKLEELEHAGEKALVVTMSFHSPDYGPTQENKMY